LLNKSSTASLIVVIGFSSGSFAIAGREYGPSSRDCEHDLALDVPAAGAFVCLAGVR